SLFFFFFSSRRRHTRSKRDWSSDVCSSDLLGFTLVLLLIAAMIIYNFTVLNNVNQTTEDVLEEDLPLLIADEQLLSDIYNQAGLARGYILNGDSKYKD